MFCLPDCEAQRCVPLSHVRLSAVRTGVPYPPLSVLLSRRTVGNLSYDVKGHLSETALVRPECSWTMIELAAIGGGVR
jgi:hypothetical protein